MNLSDHTAGLFQDLPFGDLLLHLKREGFFIEVNDVAEFTRVFQRFGDESDLAGLKYYLAPLICHNSDEQAKFYKVFDRYIAGSAAPVPDPMEVSAASPKKRQKLYLLIPTFLVASLAVLLFYRSGSQAVLASIKINTRQDSLWSGHPASFSPAFSSPVPRQPVVIEWQFGDHTEVRAPGSIEHTFETCGNYEVSMVCRDSVSGKELSRDSTAITVTVPVMLLNDSVNDFFKASDTVSIEARPADSVYLKLPFYWVITKETSELAPDTIPGKGLKQTFICREAGIYTVSIEFWGPDCNSWPKKYYTVLDNRREVLNLLPGGIPLQKVLHFSLLWLGIFLLLQGVFIALFLHFRRRERAANLLKIPKGVFSGLASPREIPMWNRNQQIVRLQSQLLAAQTLMQKTRSEVVYLDPSRTVQSTIRQLGFITPEYAPRYRQKGYLVLIDERGSGSQSVYLFTYLAKALISDNVTLSFYFYNKDPLKLYQEGSREPIYINDLTNRNDDSVLILISNGYPLLSNRLPEVSRQTRIFLNAWDKRILLTPVPANDWGGKEEILSSFFNLVPADINGLLNLFKFLNENAPRSTVFKIDDWKTYPALNVDTGSFVVLDKYLDDNDLVQWICAIAVYHKIRWEVLINVGKCVLEANGVGRKLNYTNLLKISRITWIREGSFPTDLRIELLANLSVANELVARRAMLDLMSESDPYINVNSFGYTEKVVQRYTDSFVLYSNDTSVNKAYKEDAEKFISLWENRCITDSSLKAYLNNKGHRWTTPLNSFKGEEKNVSAEKLIRKTLNSRIRPPVLLLIWYIALSALFVGPMISPALFYATKMNSLLHFVTRDYPRGGTKLGIVVPTNKCIEKLYGSNRWDTVLLMRKGIKVDTESTSQEIGPLTLAGSDTARYDTVYFDLSYSDLKAFAGNRLFIRSARGAPNYGEGFLSGDSIYPFYTISMADLDCNTGNDAQRLPPVNIQYDTSVDVNIVKAFTNCINGSSYGVATVSLTRNYPFTANMILYFDDSMRNKALSLEKAIRNCSVLALTVAKSPFQIRNSLLEIWLTDSTREPGRSTATDSAALERGIELIGSSDCATCHRLREGSGGPTIGPAYDQIAKKYANAPGYVVDSLEKKIISGGSGVWGTVPMTPHPSLRSTDVRAMVNYILSLK
jgi:cytochrome c551/c552